jgi:hypothetical protein
MSRYDVLGKDRIFVVARGGIEPPIRGFSDCELAFLLTGRAYDAEIIQGAPRKQGDDRGTLGRLRTALLVQNLVQTTPISPREAHKHTVRFTSGHATKPGANGGGKDRSTRTRGISRCEHQDSSYIDQARRTAAADPNWTEAVLVEEKIHALVARPRSRVSPDTFGLDDAPQFS